MRPLDEDLAEPLDGPALLGAHVLELLGREMNLLDEKLPIGSQRFGTAFMA
jgi:hypothetical protein